MPGKVRRTDWVYLYGFRVARQSLDVTQGSRISQTGQADVANVPLNDRVDLPPRSH